MDPAVVLRGAIANSALEGWAPTALDVERLLALATGAVQLDDYVAASIDRALRAGEVGPPDCIEVPLEFPDTFYPGTRILRNRFGIRDPRALRQLEFEVGTAQQFGIETGLVAVPATFDGAHLVAIHRALFGAVYPWAGVFRRYDMGLRDQTFGATLIERYLDDATVILQLPSEAFAAAVVPQERDRRAYAHRAATAYAYLNCAHPFREGNGRAAKTLLQLVAVRAGYRFDFSAITKKQWDGASRRSAPDPGHYRPDAHALYRVFEAITTPIE
ncbi:Fic/DOC family protein [Tsukamurella paurometabola]|uniref:protein adenylyltransferase n=1 Tax=Tsukamurella paurometabola TaxID=2061 RepID=A0A3P8L118_TSUPA|nr:Fic family protein [Tsukamurella paurometabola]UEA81171.1 Fic family protein [Tsukamurella paurometabola]VDR38145.1 Probable adenosine monophosphate-protein transferase fic [Tsukamurella paurometabola]